MLDVIYGEATSAGRRVRNEDATAVFVPCSRREVQVRGWLFALADGVGGLDGGEVASSTAVRMIADGFAEPEEQTSLASLLPRLIRHANAAVYDLALNPQWRHQRPATTAVACALRGNHAIIAHVGDSRCYLVREGCAELLTGDHSWVEEQLRRGLISEAEAAASESRHILTRALGLERSVAADSTSIPIHAGDRLILCSDGLYSVLGANGIAEISNQHDEEPQILAEQLVRKAIRRDGADNATALVIWVRSVEPTAMYRGRTYVRPGR